MAKHRHIVIHPGMIEAPRIFKRVESLLYSNGYSVAYHQCQKASSEDQPFAGSSVHIAHSSGFSCPSLTSKMTIFLIAPTSPKPYRMFSATVFAKLWRDTKDSFVKRDQAMYWYKNFSALSELTLRFSYWNKMRRRFDGSRPPFPHNQLVILYTKDPWNDNDEWICRQTVTLDGQHDEVIYRPEATLHAIFGRLKA